MLESGYLFVVQQCKVFIRYESSVHTLLTDMIGSLVLTKPPFPKHPSIACLAPDLVNFSVCHTERMPPCPQSPLSHLSTAVDWLGA
jgi:hypothetical protein